MNTTTETPQPTPEEQLAERERAIALLSFMPEIKHLTLYCTRTGVAVANMQLMQNAGKLPYLAQWQHSQSMHPLFSLSQARLLSWTRKYWNQLFRGEVMERVSFAQQEQFRVAFVAILHGMDCIKQDDNVRVLPTFMTVNDNMQRLLELAYWHNFLESKRFKFPTLRISKLNENYQLNNIAEYLAVCEDKKASYEKSRDAMLEEAKLEAALRAERAVKASHVRGVNKKALWNWFIASLAENNSKKYGLPEWKEWKDDSEKLFFASENGQLQFSENDVDAIEEVFLTECALGSIISHQFRTELERIRRNIVGHRTTFEIDWESINKSKATRTDAAGNTILGNGPDLPGDEPKIGEFDSRVKYLQAHAKWQVRKMQREDWEQRHAEELRAQVIEELAQTVDEEGEEDHGEDIDIPEPADFDIATDTGEQDE